MKNKNSLSALQPFRRFFDNSQIDSNALPNVNQFIFRCLNEEGLPLCVRQAISKGHSEFKHFKTISADVEPLSPNDILLSNVQVKIKSRSSGANALVQVECKLDKSFGETVDEYMSSTKKSDLNQICESLSINKNNIRHVPFFLLHRCNQLIQAASTSKTYFKHLIFVIHSFGDAEDFQQFKSFAKALNIPLKSPNVISQAKEITYDDYWETDSKSPMHLRLLWVKDELFTGLDS